MITKQIRIRPERCTRCLTCGAGCSRYVVPVGAANPPVDCGLCPGDAACLTLCPAGVFEFVATTPPPSWIHAAPDSPLVAAAW